MLSYSEETAIRCFEIVASNVQYTDNVTRVVWNGIQSMWFGILNGVKQGGGSQPHIILCVFDDLLKALIESKVGYYVENMFVSVIVYADDVVLLAATASAVCKLLKVCKEYAQS